MRMAARWVVPAICAVGMTVALTGCTASHSSSATTSTAPSATPAATQSSAPAPTSAAASTPVNTGPTTAATGHCPYISISAAMNALGQRTTRQQLLKSGGKTVGCRFYALQDSPLHSSENLPGAKQPNLEITTSRYADATAAHNAVVTLAEAGSNFSQVTITGVFAATYQTRFDPSDGATDWACAFSAGNTVVVIKTANNDAVTDVLGVATTVAKQVA